MIDTTYGKRWEINSEAAISASICWGCGPTSNALWDSKPRGRLCAGRRLIRVPGSHSFPPRSARSAYVLEGGLNGVSHFGRAVYLVIGPRELVDTQRWHARVRGPLQRSRGTH